MMARIRPWRWPPGCGDKRQFDTWADAEAEALRISLDAVTALHTYRCLYCGWWHFGHWNLDRTPLETARLKGLI